MSRVISERLVHTNDTVRELRARLQELTEADRS
jgi:hypothetical protein